MQKFLEYIPDIIFFQMSKLQDLIFYVDNTIKDDDKFRYKQPIRLAGTGQGKLFSFENRSKSSQSTIDDIYISFYLLFKNFIAISVVAVGKKKT
jgi:hypothetical protein